MKALNLFVALTVVWPMAFSQAQTQKTNSARKSKKTINQQIQAEAQSLKLYSDDKFKSKAKKNSSNKNSSKKQSLLLAQAGTSASYGPSTKVALPASTNKTSANISTKVADVKEPAEAATKLNGSVSMTIGQDSNIEVDRTGKEGGFFEMKPSISYEGQTFGGSFAARIKDFTKQENSDIAKETELNADVSAKFSLTESINSKSKLSFVNSDVRWPDFFNNTEKGMPIRYFETKVSQSLNYSQKSLSVGVEGSYSNRDASNKHYQRNDLLGTKEFYRDLNDAVAKSNIDLKLNDNFALSAKPMVKHRKYKSEPARLTTGERGFDAIQTPEREVLTTEVTIDLKTTLGPVSITPTFTGGQDADRALGAEDTSYTSAGASLEIILSKDLGLKVSGSANKKTVKYDNWTNGVAGGANREDDELSTSASAGVNLSNAVSLSLDYVRDEEESTMSGSDENYTREIIGTTLSVSF